MSIRYSIDEIKNWEYNVEIHDYDESTNTVTLLFREVNQKDGFGVTISLDEFKKLMKNPDEFEKWCNEQVKSRKQLLIKIVQQEKSKEEKLKKIKEEYSKVLKVVKVKGD